LIDGPNPYSPNNDNLPFSLNQKSDDGESLSLDNSPRSKMNSLRVEIEPYHELSPINLGNSPLNNWNINDLSSGINQGTKTYDTRMEDEPPSPHMLRSPSNYDYFSPTRKLKDSIGLPKSPFKFGSQSPNEVPSFESDFSGLAININTNIDLKNPLLSPPAWEKNPYSLFSPSSPKSSNSYHKFDSSPFPMETSDVLESPRTPSTLSPKKTKGNQKGKRNARNTEFPQNGSIRIKSRTLRKVRKSSNQWYRLMNSLYLIQNLKLS